MNCAICGERLTKKEEIESNVLCNGCMYQDMVANQEPEFDYTHR